MLRSVCIVLAHSHAAAKGLTATLPNAVFRRQAVSLPLHLFGVTSQSSFLARFCPDIEIRDNKMSLRQGTGVHCAVIFNLPGSISEDSLLAELRPAGVVAVVRTKSGIAHLWTHPEPISAFIEKIEFSGKMKIQQAQLEKLAILLDCQKELSEKATQLLDKIVTSTATLGSAAGLTPKALIISSAAIPVAPVSIATIAPLPSHSATQALKTKSFDPVALGLRARIILGTYRAVLLGTQLDSLSLLTLYSTKAIDWYGLFNVSSFSQFKEAYCPEIQIGKDSNSLVFKTEQAKIVSWVSVNAVSPSLDDNKVFAALVRLGADSFMRGVDSKGGRLDFGLAHFPVSFGSPLLGPVQMSAGTRTASCTIASLSWPVFITQLTRWDLGTERDLVPAFGPDICDTRENSTSDVRASPLSSASSSPVAALVSSSPSPAPAPTAAPQKMLSALPSSISGLTQGLSKLELREKLQIRELIKSGKQ